MERAAQSKAIRAIAAALHARGCRSHHACCEASLVQEGGDIALVRERPSWPSRSAEVEASLGRRRGRPPATVIEAFACFHGRRVRRAHAGCEVAHVQEEREQERRDIVSRGHIRRSGRNSFELKFDAPRENGQRRSVYRSFKGSKREAQAELTRLMAEAQTGGFIDPSKLTVIEHVRARVALWRANGSISARTEQGYR